MNDRENDDGNGDDKADKALAGGAADNVSAGISVSGVGGAEVGEEPPVGKGAEDGGMDEVIERGQQTGWGQPRRGGDQTDDERT